MRRPWLFLLPALTFAGLTYYPVTRNFFYSDDFLNLYHIANHPLPRYLLTPNGGHILLTRNAVFYIAAQVFGAYPEGYYWVVFLTHLVNVFLLFHVILRATQSPRVASFGAAVWGISPLNEGTLGWYSVYGQVIVATVLLLILSQVLDVAARGGLPSRNRLRLWYVLALAAATSFGTGIAMALVLPAVLMLLLPAWRHRLPPLLSLLVVVPLLYVVSMWTYSQLSGDPTPVWVLLRTSWRKILDVMVRLMSFGFTRLLFTFYFPPWLAPATWYALFAALGGAAVAVCWRSPAARRRQVIAVSLLMLAAYGVIAAGRAALLPPLSPEELSAGARYHYVGQLLLALLLALVLAEIPLPGGARAGNMVLAAWYAVTLLTYLRFGQPINNHSKERQETNDFIAAVRAAAAARPPGEAVRLDNKIFTPVPLPATIFPGWAAAYTVFFPDEVIDGHRVYFEPGPAPVKETLRRGRRTRALIPPEAS